MRPDSAFLFSGYEPRMNKLRSAILEAVPSAQVEGGFSLLYSVERIHHIILVFRKGWKKDLIRGDGQ